MKFSTACLALAAVTAVSTVDAYTSDLGRLPHYRDDNTIFRKELGHPGGNTGQTTKFAQDMRSVGSKWPALCEIDSDGDNKTNGEELGDPCCQFIKSGYEMPEIFPKDDLSDPDNANDTTNLSKPGTCPPPPAKIVKPPTPTPVQKVTPTPTTTTTTPTPTPTPTTTTVAPTPTPTPTPTPKTQTVYTVSGVDVEVIDNGDNTSPPTRNDVSGNGAAAGLAPTIAAAVLCVAAALL